MEDFISLKRSVGYKYNTEPGILKRFDSYLLWFFESRTVSIPWCRSTSRTLSSRASEHRSPQENCIYRLKQWAQQDRDLMVLIPMMRTYLGHQTFPRSCCAHCFRR